MVAGAPQLGAKKISESSLLDRNSFSISGVVLNEASSTSGEIAFHTDVLPARWLKMGLMHIPTTIVLAHEFTRRVLMDTISCAVVQRAE